jgi:hypothetical protein
MSFNQCRNHTAEEIDGCTQRSTHMFRLGSPARNIPCADVTQSTRMMSNDSPRRIKNSKNIFLHYSCSSDPSCICQKDRLTECVGYTLPDFHCYLSSVQNVCCCLIVTTKMMEWLYIVKTMDNDIMMITRHFRGFVLLTIISRSYGDYQWDVTRRTLNKPWERYEIVLTVWHFGCEIQSKLNNPKCF